MILQAFYLPEMRIFVTQNRMSSALFGYNSLLRKVEILRISSFLCSFSIADCALRRIHIRLSVAFDDFCSKSSWPQEELRTKNSAYYSPFYLENIYLTEFLMTQLLLKSAEEFEDGSGAIEDMLGVVEEELTFAIGATDALEKLLEVLETDRHNAKRLDR